MHLLTTLLAQATGPTTSPTNAPGPLFRLFSDSLMFPLLIGFALLMYLSYRTKSNERKQRDNMLSRLKKGDRVQTIGGILGTVVEAREGDVLVKVDESSNTKIRFARSAIHRVIAEDDKVEAR